MTCQNRFPRILLIESLPSPLVRGGPEDKLDQVLQDQKDEQHPDDAATGIVDGGIILVSAQTQELANLRFALSPGSK
jgi:hypothetical protein